MNWLDHWLGPTNPISATEAGERLRCARRVLLVKPHHKLGDLMVATPVIRNLRRALPGARLTFVAGIYNAPAVLDSPDLDEVVVARLKGPAAPFAATRLVRRLRRERFDAAILLSSISHSATAVALARQARAGFVAGLDDAPYGSDLARRGYDCVLEPPEDLKTHIVDYNLTLLERLGVPITTREHVLGVAAGQLARAGDILRESGIDLDRPVLGVQLGGTANRSDRHWPPSHYAVLTQRARAELGFQILLLGQSVDRTQTETFQHLGRHEVPALLDLPFSDYKAVLKRLTFFITHDGGPVHVAAGVGVPSYFVFLATPPWRRAPYGEHVHVWDEYERTPTPTDVWERLEPCLQAVLGGSSGVEEN